MDEKRQWFKARVGFEPHETTLDQSVCSHAILDEGYTEIADMGADPRTSDNPLYVGDPRVKFYAGANLVAPNGQPIGTLCVLDTKPRTLNDFQRQALQTLSRHVMMQLELRKKIRIEAALRAEMDHRVKNSFQTIASLLRMATRKVHDPDYEVKWSFTAWLYQTYGRWFGVAVFVFFAGLTLLLRFLLF